MLVTREWAYGSLRASGNLMVPFLFDGAACRADYGHPAHHQSRESWPSDLPAHECEVNRTRTAQSPSPGETASLHHLGTALGDGSQARGMLSVFAECISRKGLGDALNARGVSEQLIGQRKRLDALPNRF